MFETNIENFKMMNRRYTITLHSLSFSFGLVTFLAMIGFFASTFQPILFKYRGASQITAGMLLIIFGLILGGWVPIPRLTRVYRVQLKKKPSGFIGSYLIGLAFAVGWTPCIGPILGSVFAMAATAKVNAFFMLLSYGLGLSIPFVLSGYFFVSFMTGFRKLQSYLPIIIKISAVILILTGILLFFGGFALFPKYFAFVPSFVLLPQRVKVPMVFLAFVGGILSFISPCLLPIVPGFLAYISGVSVIEEETNE